VQQIDADTACVADMVVVDNNSDDRTREFVVSLARINPWISYVQESKQGLSHARNRGSKESTALYLCFLDDDSVIGDDYISNVLKVLIYESPDIMGGPIFPFYASEKSWWFNDRYETRCHTNKSGYADCPISGGNYVIKRDLLIALGGFSSDFGMVANTLALGEDRELLERYRVATPADKRKIFYSLECSVKHLVPAHKMTMSYFIKRAFSSGVMYAEISDSLGSDILSRGDMKRLPLARRVIEADSLVDGFVRAIHYVFRNAGFLISRLRLKYFK
jgi:glycosyltransferase involved in cell wall biosynthesis